MGRRGENIRKRADGRWEARVVQGTPVKGKTNYKYIYGKNYQEVRRKKKAFQNLLFAECSSGMAGDFLFPRTNSSMEKSSLLFQEVALKWLAAKKTKVKESTFAYYHTMEQSHLLPELGNIIINEITEKQLEDFFVALKERGNQKNGGALSEKTIFDLRNMLRQIFFYANSEGYIRTVPKCPRIVLPHPVNRVLTKQEQALVEQVVIDQDTPITLGILISLYGGPRIGEVCGLQWKDFDFQNGTVHIERTVSRITDVDGTSPHKTKVVIGTPKTACSIRTIPLPENVFEYFRLRRKENRNYLITGTSKYMEPRVYQEHFKKILKLAGVSERTYHSLRHTFATRCVENGVDMKSLSEIMGHSDVKITMQRYVHPSMDAKKEQVNKLPFFYTNGQNRSQGRADPDGIF